ncbi:MAG: NADH-quinone oxidoreductase subunit J [Deltaproteobacteria bacterium]|nr:NADH-quinone oxidoreductase subunit J [Deltaproteobacteria bacterium]
MFYLFAAVCVGGALIAVFRREPVVGAVGLIAMLLGVAGVFVLLHAHFLAVVQVLVYAGAVMVLIVFVIFLVDPRREGPLPLRGIIMKGFGAIAAVFILLEVGRAFLRGGGSRAELPAGFGSIEAFGEALFGAWLLPFELVSALLVVAMVAALVLAKRRT